MNRKVVAGGLILLVGLAGFAGVRFLENQTETVVRDALEGASAKATEVRYSLLGNTLSLKGVTYEVTDDGWTRRGSVESVEVTGFNRACLATGADAAAYDADKLPLVAESVVITGLCDRNEGAGMQVEQKFASLQMRGWYQRLGVFLEQYRQHLGEASWYEEMFRYRLDAMDADHLTLSLTEKDVLSMEFSVDAVMLAEGVRAPRGTEKVAPMSLIFEGIHFTGTDMSEITVSGDTKTLTVRDLLLPEPAAMVELLAANRAMIAADLDTDAGMETFEEQYMKMMDLLRKIYEKKLPFSGFSMKEMKVSAAPMKAAAPVREPLVMVGLNSLDYTLALTDSGEHKAAVNLDELLLDMAELRRDDILKRYAPEGFVLSAEGESVTSDEKFSGHAWYELKGLAELSLGLTLGGDISGLERLYVDPDSADPFAVIQRVIFESMNMEYKDSGLLPMTIELAAREQGRTPEAILDVLFQNLSTVGLFQNKASQQLGPMLTEQLTMPGEFGMSFVPEKPVSLMEFLSMLLEFSEDLPVAFSSVPGEKPLKDYLPKN